MCELLIRVRAKEGITEDKVHLFFERGDVIAVNPDGWGWTQMELANPDWRIVRLEGVAADDMQDFLMPEQGDPLVNFRLRRRGKRIDCDGLSLPIDLRAWLDADSNDGTVKSVDKAAFDVAVVTKTILPNPNVVG